MKHDIPIRLLTERSALLVAPDDHRVSYNAGTWLKCFSGDKDFSDLTQKYPETISRSEIADLAQNENTRKVFLAAMLWGYGTVGYGAYRTSIMLGEKSSETIIEKSFDLVSAGNYILAYEIFTLPMCGAAFFTKYFYFVGLGRKVSPLPLILDSVVANSLARLDVDISQLARFTKNSGGRITSLGKYTDGYLRYVEMMNNWAGELGCRPDSIEKWLFTLQD